MFNLPLPLTYSIKVAVVVGVHKTYVECAYIDDMAQSSFQCPIPHPIAGVDGGIFYGIEKDTYVLISTAQGEVRYIVAVLPNRGLYFGQAGVKDAPLYRTPYPNVRAGEVWLKGKPNSYFGLTDAGAVLDVQAGSHSFDFEISNSSRAMFVRTDNVLEFTEAGRSVRGVVKRNVRLKEPMEGLDLLSGEKYDRYLSEVGRSPKDDIHFRTINLGSPAVRNPALVENRSIVYEYADKFGVSTFEEEVDEVTKTEERAKDPPEELEEDADSFIVPRNRKRTDVFNLNKSNYNSLIEKIEGTSVDIYGNILDINRNIIRVPRWSETNQQYSEAELKRHYSFLNRSIKYHFEINSRKGVSSKDEDSRWSIDVDGEGLTKINVPASSELGNIPLFGRFVNKDISEGGIEKNEDSVVQDVYFVPLKKGEEPGGQEIADSAYRPKVPEEVKSAVRLVTPYHDLTKIAPSVFESGKLRDPEAKGGASVGPLVTRIFNQIPEVTGAESGPGVFDLSPDRKENAGGRSVSANLDGSLEIAIGADSADGKSIALDADGSIVSHIGRDKNGRSIIQQTDGDVIVQIGGVAKDQDRPGRVEIHLNRPGKPSQKIIIDEAGITLDIHGNALFKSSGDFSIVADGDLLLHGESVYTYGTAEDVSRKIRTKERRISRKGRVIN